MSGPKTNSPPPCKFWEFGRMKNSLQEYQAGVTGVLGEENCQGVGK